MIDNITKKGTITYCVGVSAVRNDGDRLQVSTGTDRASVQEALRLAAERYGSRTAVNSTTEFKAHAIRAVVDGKLLIRLLIQLWKSAVWHCCKTVSA